MPIASLLGFDIRGQEPADARNVSADRLSIDPAVAYNGMIVYDTSQNRWYGLLDRTAIGNTASWEDLGEGGTSVIANPGGVGNADLTSITIGDTNYDIPSGGGGGDISQAEFNALDHRVTVNEGELADAVQPNEITTTTTTETTVRNGVNTFGSTFTGYTGTFGSGTLSIQRSTAFPAAVNALVRGNILGNNDTLANAAELSFVGRTERPGTHHVTFTAHNAAATTLINNNLTAGFINTLTNAQVMNVLQNMQLLVQQSDTSTTVMPGPATGVISSPEGFLQRRDLALSGDTGDATDIATRGYVDSRATSSGNYDSTNTGSPRGITGGATADTFVAGDVGSVITFENVGAGLDWVAGDTGFGHSGDFNVNVDAVDSGGTGFNFTVVSYNTTTGELVVTAREIFKTTGRSHANWDVTKQLLPIAYTGSGGLTEAQADMIYSRLNDNEYRNVDLITRTATQYSTQGIVDAFNNGTGDQGATILFADTPNPILGIDNTNPVYIPGTIVVFELLESSETAASTDVFFLAEVQSTIERFPEDTSQTQTGVRFLFQVVSFSDTLGGLSNTNLGPWRIRSVGALEALTQRKGAAADGINSSWIENTANNVGDAQTSENFNVSYTLPQLAAIGLTFDPLTLENDTLPFDENGGTLTNPFVLAQDTNQVAIGTDTADVLDAYLTSTLSAADQTAISNGLADTNPTNYGALIEFTVGGEIAGLFFQRDPEDLVWRMNNGFAPAPNGINVPAGTAFRLRYFDQPIPVFNNAGRVPFEGSEADLDAILLGYNGITTPVDGIRYLPLVNNAQLTSAYVDTNGTVTTTVESMTKRRDAFGPFLDLELNESYRDLNGNRSNIYEPLIDTNARSISLQLVSKVLNSDLYTEGNAAGSLNIDGKEVRVPGALDGSERFERDQAGDVAFIQQNPLTGFNDGIRITYTDNTTNSGTKSSIVEIPGIQSNRDRIRALEGGGDAHSHTSDAFGSFPYPGSVSGTFADGNLVGNADGFNFNTVNPVWRNLTTVTDAAQAHINAGRTFSTGTASQTLATPLGLNFIIGASTKVQGGSFPWLGTSLRPGEFNLRAGQNLITGDTSDPARELFLALENSFLWGYTDETATYRNSLSFGAGRNVNAGAPGLTFGVTPTQRNPLTQFIGNGEYRQDVVVSFVGFNGVEEELNLGLTRVVHYTGPLLAQDNSTTVNIPDTGAGSSTRGEYLSHQAGASHYVITNGTVPKGFSLGRLDAQMFWLYPIIQDPATRSSSQFTRRVVNYSGGAQTVGIENRYGNPNNPDIGNELRFYLPDDELNEIYGQDGRLTQTFQFPGIARTDIQNGLGSGVNGFARDITLDFASIDPTDSTAVLLPTIGQDDWQVSDGGSSLRSRLTGSAITITDIGPSDPLDNLFGRQFRVQIQTFDTAIPNFQFVTRYNNADQRSGWIGINQNNPDSVLSVAYTPRFFVDGSANGMGETRVSNLLRRDDPAATFIFDGASGDLLPVAQYPTEAEYALSQVTIGRIDYGSGRETSYIDLSLPTVGDVDFEPGTNIGPQLGTSSVITELWQANLGSNVNLHTLGGPRDTTSYPQAIQASWFYNQRIQQPDGKGGMEDSLVLTTPDTGDVLTYTDTGILEFSPPTGGDNAVSADTIDLHSQNSDGNFDITFADGPSVSGSPGLLNFSSNLQFNPNSARLSVGNSVDGVLALSGPSGTTVITAGDVLSGGNGTVNVNPVDDVNDYSLLMALNGDGDNQAVVSVDGFSVNADASILSVPAVNVGEHLDISSNLLAGLINIAGTPTQVLRFRHLTDSGAVGVTRHLTIDESGNVSTVNQGDFGSGRGFSVEGTAVGGTGAVDFNDDQTPSPSHRVVTFSSGADNTIQAEVDITGLGGGGGDVATALDYNNLVSNQDLTYLTDANELQTLVDSSSLIPNTIYEFPDVGTLIGNTSGGGGSGTVTNVATGTGLTGGPITTSGTIALDSDSIDSLALADTAVQPANVLTALNALTGSIDADLLANAPDNNTQLSDEQVQDIVGAMVSGNTETNIAVTYDDTNGKLDFAASGGAGGSNVPNSPANQITVRDYQLRVPGISGDATWEQAPAILNHENNGNNPIVSISGGTYNTTNDTLTIPIFNGGTVANTTTFENRIIAEQSGSTGTSTVLVTSNGSQDDGSINFAKTNLSSTSVGTVVGEIYAGGTESDTVLKNANTLAGRFVSTVEGIAATDTAINPRLELINGLQIDSLSGSGNRIITANADGLLTDSGITSIGDVTQAGTNIFTGNNTFSEVPVLIQDSGNENAYLQLRRSSTGNVPTLALENTSITSFSTGTSLGSINANISQGTAITQQPAISFEVGDVANVFGVLSATNPTTIIENELRLNSPGFSLPTGNDLTNIAVDNTGQVVAGTGGGSLSNDRDASMPVTSITGTAVAYDATNDEVTIDLPSGALTNVTQTADGIRITSADDGSGNEPDLELYRDSASPASGDNVGFVGFRGNRQGSNITYASFTGNIDRDGETSINDTRSAIEFNVRGVNGSQNLVDVGRFQHDGLAISGTGTGITFDDGTRQTTAAVGLSTGDRTLLDSISPIRSAAGNYVIPFVARNASQTIDLTVELRETVTSLSVVDSGVAIDLPLSALTAGTHEDLSVTLTNAQIESIIAGNDQNHTLYLRANGDASTDTIISPGGGVIQAPVPTAGSGTQGTAGTTATIGTDGFFGYSEGAFTPTFRAGFTGFNIDHAPCRYIRIGSKVSIWGTIRISRNTDAINEPNDGIVPFQGLPYIPGNVENDNGDEVIGLGTGTVRGQRADQISTVYLNGLGWGFQNNAGQFVTLEMINGFTTNMGNPDFPAGSNEFYFTAEYFTDFNT